MCLQEAVSNRLSWEKWQQRVSYNVIRVSENVVALSFYSGCVRIIIKQLWRLCRHSYASQVIQIWVHSSAASYMNGTTQHPMILVCCRSTHSLFRRGGFNQQETLVEERNERLKLLIRQTERWLLSGFQRWCEKFAGEKDCGKEISAPVMGEWKYMQWGCCCSLDFECNECDPFSGRTHCDKRSPSDTHSARPLCGLITDPDSGDFTQTIDCNS